MPVQGLEFKLYVGRSVLVRVGACKILIIRRSISKAIQVGGFVLTIVWACLGLEEKDSLVFVLGNLFCEQLVPRRWYKRLQGGELGEGCNCSVYIFCVF